MSILWQQLDQLVEMHSIDWQWVKGHSGHAEMRLPISWQIAELMSWIKHKYETDSFRY